MNSSVVIFGAKYHQYVNALFILQFEKCSNVKLFPNCQSLAPNPKPQTLSPKPFSPKLKTKGPWADTKISWATHPITLKHFRSTMFSENIINLTCCIIIKIPAFTVDKISAGRTKCRSPALWIRTFI